MTELLPFCFHDGEGLGLPLILGSASPRRREIIRMLGGPFQIAPAEIDEAPLPGETAAAAAIRVAVAKTAVIAVSVGEALVLGADTVVVYRGRILGKPKDEAEATKMLRQLRGRAHRVITGVSLQKGPERCVYSAATTTRVWMRSYSDAEIAAYVASGEAFDKAGAYAIQSREFHPVERIEGCYLNVVGLPLCEVVKGLAHLGLHVPQSVLDALIPSCSFCARFREA